MRSHSTANDVSLLEHVVSQAAADRKSRIGICVEAAKNIQACLAARNFVPISGGHSLTFAEGDLRESFTFVGACSRVFYALIAHLHLLYSMLDACAFKDSICEASELLRTASTLQVKLLQVSP